MLDHKSLEKSSKFSPGITLMEILIVMGLLGLVIGGVSLGVGALTQSNLKNSASRVGATISFLAHESVIKGRPMRLAIDLGTNNYRVEIMAQTDDRAALYLSAAEKRTQNEEETSDREDNDSNRSPSFGTAGSGLELGITDLFQAPTATRQKPVWEPLSHKEVKIAPLSGTVKFAGIYTPQQTEPFYEGKGYVYFWPSGQTEHSLIYLAFDGAEDHETDKFFSVLVEPLTGRAKVFAGRYELPSDVNDFDEAEDFEEEDDFGL